MAQRLSDYGPPLLRRTIPATDMAMPPGGANAPVSAPGQAVAPTAADLLKLILDELKLNQEATKPILRSAAVTAAGITLDWTAFGQMKAVAIRNMGPNPCWISFDINGAAVDNFTSDNSFELLSLESLNMPRCLFTKIGCRTTGILTTTVHAVAFQRVMSGAIL